MGDAYIGGTCRAIGVSNYFVKHLEELAKYARIMPAANQVEFSPRAPLQKLVQYCRDNNIVLEAFSWLTPHVLELPQLQEIADALERTAVQVLLRWFVMQGIAPLWQTQLEERLLENAAAFSDDFELSEAQVASIS